MGLADLHIHTIYSYDGTASVPAVLAQAKQVGLDVIAITDHDEVKGALKAFELAPQFGIEVIPGIEITTAEGDLLDALWVGATDVRRGVPMSSIQMLGTWAVNFVISIPARLAVADL